MLSVLAEDIRDGSQGSFFLVYAIVTMSIGLPLSYLLSVIGQISSMGCVQAWKMVPITKGIGIGLALMMHGIAVVKSVTLGYAIYYLILAFHRVIDNYHSPLKTEKRCNLLKSHYFQKLIMCFDNFFLQTKKPEECRKNYQNVDVSS